MKYGYMVVREIFNLSIFQKIIYLFAFGCVGSSLLCGLFSSCAKQGLLSSCREQASDRGGFFCCGRALGLKGFSSCSTWHSIVVAPRLQSTGSIAVARGLSCSAACGIFPDQGLNLCLLLCQVDSLPLSHQGSPYCCFQNCTQGPSQTRKINVLACKTRRIKNDQKGINKTVLSYSFVFFKKQKNTVLSLHYHPQKEKGIFGRFSLR